MELIGLALEDFFRLGVAVIDELANLLVDRVSSDIGDLLVPGDAAPEKDLAVVFTVRQRSEPV